MQGGLNAAARRGMPVLTNQPMLDRFREYLNEQIEVNRLPCAEIIVSHKGKVICDFKNGGAVPAAANGDMLYRQYSMTKTIVASAAMVLFERGKYQLNQPVWRFLGDKWKKEQMKVIDLKQSLATKSLVLVPCQNDITLGQLMTHTSGLSHGLLKKGQGNPLDDIYSDMGISGDECILLEPPEKGLPSLQDFCDKLATAPLLFQPGENWQYSYGMEVMGRIIEVVSGAKDLNEFVQDNICRKLGMIDTTFYPSEEQKKRICPFYIFDPATNKLTAKVTYFPTYCSGSAGLYASGSDYHKFCRALLRGGLGDNGQRILSSRTVEWMMENHIHRGGNPSTIREMSLVPFMVAPGNGFGLGGAVTTDTGYDNQLGSLGEFSWAGAVCTTFWIDPVEEIVATFMTSVFEPDKDKFPIHATVRALVYGALNDTKKHPHVGGHNSRGRRGRGVGKGDKADAPATNGVAGKGGKDSVPTAPSSAGGKAKQVPLQ